MEFFSALGDYIRAYVTDSGIPLGFVYAILWIPCLLFWGGLQYYSTLDELPPKLKTAKKVLLCVVVSLPVGLIIATQSIRLVVDKW